MTRVLYVSPFSAWAAHDHAAEDILPQLVPRLAKRCELSFYSPATGLLRVAPDGATEVVEATAPRRPAGRVRQHVGVRPSWLRAVWGPGDTQDVLRHARTLRADVVHAEYLQASEPLLDVDTPATVTLHDAGELVTRQLASSGTPVRRAVRRVDAWRTTSFEQAVCGTADRVLTFSDGDTAFFASRGVPAVRVPMGYDVPQARWAPPAHPGPARLLFFGAMWRRANALAVVRLVRDVMPLVWASRPDVELHVVGSAPTAEVLRLGAADRRVKVLGRVDDPDEAYMSSDICLAPTEVHGGVLIKLLRGLALGCPVVTSPVGARSLRLSDGVEALIADGPGEWAAACLRLLAEPELAAAVGGRGRDHVAVHHGWDDMADAYVDQFEQVARRA